VTGGGGASPVRRARFRLSPRRVAQSLSLGEGDSNFYGTNFR
jgi:hypothetical protein